VPPTWIRTVIWWHVYPLGFTGADPSGADRTRGRGLRALIPWLDHALRLGANGLALAPIFQSEAHGYDTVDHFRIDDRLGDDAAFDELVAAAHARGLRVLLDGVFNHVGRSSVALAAHPAWTKRGPDGGPATFEGHATLVELDHANPDVADYVTGVLDHWLDRGADGWRFDAAYTMPTGFLADVVSRSRARHPDAYFIGEVLHGDYAQIVDDARLDSVTQYELWKAIWSSLNDRNFFELAWAIKRHDAWLSTFVPLTFVGNHDVTRLASALTDERHVPHALAILFTLAGTPSVYYGDELGLLGVKEHRAGGDDAIRPEFPDRPGELTGAAAETFRLHQLLTGLRRRHPWVHAARTTTVQLANRQLAYDVNADGQRLRVALSTDDEPWRLPLTGTAARVLAASPGVRVEGAVLVVEPHGWAVVE
jgi:cyclomaltodextrinase / maltogenic alpha-amylase / neopullulanase